MWYAAVCGGSCGQKRSQSFAGNDFPVWTGSVFHPSDCLHCNSEGGIQQVFSAPSTPQKLGGCKQRSEKRLFAQFLIVLCRFCSVPLAFRHSLKPLFPCTPRRTVAENVVKNAPCPLPETVSRFGQGAFFIPLTVCMVTLRAGFSKSFLRCPHLRNCGAVNNESAYRSLCSQSALKSLTTSCSHTQRMQSFSSMSLRASTVLF